MSNLFVKKLQLPPEDQEIRFVLGQKRTCYNGVYPFKIFPQKELSSLTFAPVTILYGGNGSGKTTLLNILAEALQLTRHSPFSGGAYVMIPNQETVDAEIAKINQVKNGEILQP